MQRPPFLLETTTPGEFAVGDVRHGSMKRVASAVGDGSTGSASSTITWPSRPPSAKVMNPSYKPGERFGTSFATHERT